MPSSRDLLPGLLARLAVSTRNARALEPIWRAAVGPAIARASHPVHLEDGHLRVRVTEPGWAAELRERAESLRALLSERCGVRLAGISFIEGP